MSGSAVSANASRPSVSLASSLRALVHPLTQLDESPNTAFDSSLDRSKAKYTFEDSEEQKFVPIAVLECRGCEILAFDPLVRLFQLSLPFIRAKN